jgi:N-acetylmuramoyl-L-alanine amidase
LVSWAKDRFNSKEKEMRVVISSGHGKYIRGASGYLDEVDEARRVVDKVAQLMVNAGHTVKTFHDDTSHDQSTNLSTIVNYHNSQSRDLDVSVHFNAYQTTSKPMGTEVLYVTQSSLASRISDLIATAADLPDRGAKYRSDLYFLNNTHEPAVLLEVCFVDSSTDAAHYNGNFDAICDQIAEGITGQEIGEQPPVERPPVEPPEYTGENRVEITTEVIGDVSTYVNGTLIRGHEPCEHVVKYTVKLVGDVTLVVNGEEFHNKPPAGGIQDNHRNIEATVFGGASDPNNSAYPPFGYLNDTDLYVALPYSFPNDLFPDNPPRVRVYCGELSAEARVADKGPWTVDDDAYVNGTARPIAETCHDEGAPLPSGPNAGKVPTNRAGIDLSPALAGKIGVSGKGQVNWEFIT